MRAVVWHGRRDVRTETVPDPRLELPTDVIVRITSTGLCGSDLHLYEVMAPFMTSGVPEPTSSTMKVAGDLTIGQRGSLDSRFDQADCGGSVRRIPAPAEALEVRWFVPGARPPRLWRPDRRPRTRVDAYHDQSLRVTFSLKRRGESGPWERKHRVERTHVALFGDAAVAETWTKEPPQWSDPPGGSWTAVSKRIWRRAGVEVVDLRVEDERWWSVALKLRPSSPAFGALEQLVGLAASGGVSGSYPAWLIERPVSGRRIKARRPNDACPGAMAGSTPP